MSDLASATLSGLIAGIPPVVEKQGDPAMEQICAVAQRAMEEAVAQCRPIDGLLARNLYKVVELLVSRGCSDRLEEEFVATLTDGVVASLLQVLSHKTKESPARVLLGLIPPDEDTDTPVDVLYQMVGAYLGLESTRYESRA